mmetsp:Transcript_119405/g.338590  ORF Transcript_119405/g.338590 Transcript_119405/m.338590 type:complete len:227 (-) Transcript_119405:985-1665(-)
MPCWAASTSCRSLERLSLCPPASHFRSRMSCSQRAIRALRNDHSVRKSITSFDTTPTERWQSSTAEVASRTICAAAAAAVAAASIVAEPPCASLGLAPLPAERPTVGSNEKFIGISNPEPLTAGVRGDVDQGDAPRAGLPGPHFRAPPLAPQSSSRRFCCRPSTALSLMVAVSITTVSASTCCLTAEVSSVRNSILAARGDGVPGALAAAGLQSCACRARSSSWRR